MTGADGALGADGAGGIERPERADAPEPADGGPGALEAAFAREGFISPPGLAATLYLAERLGRPVLLEGPAGVGKTETAKLWAQARGARLVRLQCYEGLDESKALYEWAYGKQMLYAQLLKERTAEIVHGAATLRDAVARLERQADAFFSEAFLLRRPVLEAVLAEEPVVLLVDEIDRADPEVEAFLLEALSEGQVTVPELGTLRARRPIRAVLTSNDTRDLSSALRRRCLYCYVDYPDATLEQAILEARVPGLGADLARRVARFVARVRESDPRKTPGIAEAIDWASALVVSGFTDLDATAIRATLGALLKTREDLERVGSDPGSLR